MTKDNIPARHCASPRSLTHEIDPDYFDPLAVDPQQATAVARWRHAERTRLPTELSSQPHDIAMPIILTETDPHFPKENP